MSKQPLVPLHHLGDGRRVDVAAGGLAVRAAQVTAVHPDVRLDGVRVSGDGHVPVAGIRPGLSVGELLHDVGEISPCPSCLRICDPGLIEDLLVVVDCPRGVVLGKPPDRPVVRAPGLEHGQVLTHVEAVLGDVGREVLHHACFRELGRVPHEKPVRRVAGGVGGHDLVVITFGNALQLHRDVGVFLLERVDRALRDLQPLARIPGHVGDGDRGPSALLLAVGPQRRGADKQNGHEDHKQFPHSEPP